MVEVVGINELGPYRIKLWDNTFDWVPVTNKSTYEYLMYGCEWGN